MDLRNTFAVRMRRDRLAIAGFFITFFVLASVVMTLRAKHAEAAAAIPVTLPFTYAFTTSGTLVETGAMNDSSSPYWWLNSGARMFFHDGVGSTIQGELPVTDTWAKLYAQNNPWETDNGLHPQNVFRLLSRPTWQNVSQKVSYRMNTYHLSTDEHRSASNGLLLFNRYQDGMNTYYAGVRVDGNAVIKKKKNGTYYSMKFSKAFPGAYNRNTNPNLLPLNTSIKLKTEVKNLDAKRVEIKLYMDVGKTGVWKLIASAIDDGASYGGAAFTQAGHGGMRTDFMDVDFDDYEVKSL